MSYIVLGRNEKNFYFKINNFFYLLVCNNCEHFVDCNTLLISIKFQKIVSYILNEKCILKKSDEIVFSETHNITDIQLKQFMINKQRFIEKIKACIK